MNRVVAILLLITECLLVAKLVINRDLLLTLTIILSQVVILLAAFNFESKESRGEPEQSKKQFLVGIFVFLSVIPLLLFHQSRFEPSSWHEAGLLVQGPYSVMLLLFGVFGIVIAALTSLYLRGRR